MLAVRFPYDGRRAAPRYILREIQSMVTLAATGQKSAARSDLAAVESKVCQRNILWHRCQPMQQGAQ